ncbi:MAG: ABC transporter permease [Kangiella sp.]|nr:ABC transporter permease [Kangiella sp.]
MTLPDIGYLELCYVLLPVVLVGIIFYRWSIGLSDLLIATVRMVVQLIAIGFVLVYLFTSESWLLGLAVMSFMLLVSGWIAMRPLKYKNSQHFMQLATALFFGCGSVLALIIVAVLHLEPWYQPRYVIPLAGMLLANTMNSLSLAGERLDSELSISQAQEQARNKAFNTAMIPQINSLLAVGLVALPGMMTGQILSGVSPLLAVRYQIVIMATILCSAAFSVAIYLSLRLKTQLTNQQD